MESCNCDYLCPCIYTNPQGPATHDHCTAVMAFRIEEGESDSVTLAGLKFALVIRSGKVMADGNWIFAGVVDATANPDQPSGIDGHRWRRCWRPTRLHPAESGQRFPRH